jgi:hypothetical protein
MASNSSNITMCREDARPLSGEIKIDNYKE